MHSSSSPQRCLVQRFQRRSAGGGRKLAANGCPVRGCCRCRVAPLPDPMERLDRNLGENLFTGGLPIEFSSLTRLQKLCVGRDTAGASHASFSLAPSAHGRTVSTATFQARAPSRTCLVVYRRCRECAFYILYLAQLCAAVRSSLPHADTSPTRHCRARFRHLSAPSPVWNRCALPSRGTRTLAAPHALSKAPLAAT